MADVGGTSCTFVKGRPGGERSRISLWAAQGYSGYGAVKSGKGHTSFRFQCVGYDTYANLKTWIAALEAKVGTTVTIVDDHADSHANCFIASIRPIQPQIAAASSSVSTHRCELIVEGVQIV